MFWSSLFICVPPVKLPPKVRSYVGNRIEVKTAFENQRRDGKTSVTQSEAELQNR